MATARHLARPPILEALVDLRFAGGSQDAALLKPLADAYEAEGWSLKRMDSFAATFAPFRAAGPEVTESSKQLEGYRLESTDGTQVLVLRSDRLTVSRISGYHDWSDLGRCAQAAFGRYTEAVLPTAVTRIAARFINRIVPSPDIQTFERILTRVPLPLPGEGLEGGRIVNFLRRHVVDGLRDGFTANLTIGTVIPEASEDIGHINPIVIDIDVFKTCELAPSFDDVALELNKIRSIKNSLFFGSLTDEAVGKYT